MKKIFTLTVLATVAAVAAAEVRIDGKIGTTLDNTEVAGAGATALVAEPTSNVRITAGEKLANGMGVNAVIETSLNGNTIGGAGTQLGDRQSTIGITAGSFGLDLGRNLHSTFLAITNNDSFDTGYGSVAGDVHNTRGLRLDRAATVRMEPTKNVQVEYGRTATGAANEASSWSISGSMGGFTGSAAQWKQGTEESTVYGVNWKSGNLGVYYSHSDDRGVAPSKGDLVGVRYNLSNNMAVKASVGRTNTGVDAAAVGVDYSLSKSTVVNVAYRHVDTGVETKQIGAGIVFKF